jgi:hypothetical protein
MLRLRESLTEQFFWSQHALAAGRHANFVAMAQRTSKFGNVLLGQNLHTSKQQEFVAAKSLECMLSVWNVP